MRASWRWAGRARGRGARGAVSAAAPQTRGAVAACRAQRACVQERCCARGPHSTCGDRRQFPLRTAACRLRPGP
jgi:hypothetical protein